MAYGQIEKSNNLAQLDVVLSPPKFPAKEMILQGKKIGSIEDYLKANLQYPEKTLDKLEQGTEIVHFIVTPTGELISMSIVNSVSPEIDAEVVRVLKATNGKWQPAFANGEPIAMAKDVSMVFKLQETTNFVSMARKYSKKGNNKLFVLKDPKKALKYYEKGINLLPNEDFLLTMRGICKFELGDKDGASKDWSRIKNDKNAVDQIVSDDYISDDIRELDGYSEMHRMTEK